MPAHSPKHPQESPPYMPVKTLLAITTLALVSLILPPTTPAETYDTILKGARVIDGSGAQAYRADIAVRDGLIVALGDLAEHTAAQVVNLTGLMIVPGFIDLHSHADGSRPGGLRSRNPQRRAAPNLVAQGATTLVVNQDGRSAQNIGRQRRQLESRNTGPNVALMVGHNTVRAQVLGPDAQRPATALEIARMAQLVREGMEAGAFGLSAGLEYPPGIWSTTAEVMALVSEIAPYNGVYIVHERASGSDPMWFLPSRNSGTPSTMIDSIKETIRIAEQTGVTTVATHIKARGVDYWGASTQIINEIEDARARGVRIFADQYPYLSSGSDGVTSLIPAWIVKNRPKDDDTSPDYPEILRDALRDPDTARAMEMDIRHQARRRGGADNILILDYPDASLIGTTLARFMDARNLSLIEAVYALQFEGYKDRLGGARLRGFSLSENDLRAFAARPWVATASDAGIALPGDGPVHARFYGTFPRKLRRYALDQNVLSLEAAIRSMTSLPAEILGLKDRGLIKEGFAADLVVMDPANLRDTSTFLKPHQYPEGIEYVMINGEWVVAKGRLTYALPGKILTLADAVGYRNTD